MAIVRPPGNSQRHGIRMCDYDECQYPPNAKRVSGTFSFDGACMTIRRGSVLAPRDLRSQ
jgi:hypothetical protein